MIKHEGYKFSFLFRRLNNHQQNYKLCILKRNSIQLQFSQIEIPSRKLFQKLVKGSLLRLSAYYSISEKTEAKWNSYYTPTSRATGCEVSTRVAKRAREVFAFALVSRAESSYRRTANLRAQIAAFKMCRDSEIGEFRLAVRCTIKSSESDYDLFRFPNNLTQHATSHYSFLRNRPVGSVHESTEFKICVPHFRIFQLKNCQRA